MKVYINTQKVPNWISIPLIGLFTGFIIHTLIKAGILWMYFLSY